MAEVTSGSLAITNVIGKTIGCIEWKKIRRSSEITTNQTFIEVSLIGNSNCLLRNSYFVVNDKRLNGNSYIELRSGKTQKYSLYIPHEDDGTCILNISLTYTIADIYGSGRLSVSNSYELPRIPQESVFGDISGNIIGSECKVNIISEDTSFVHTLTYQVGNSQVYEFPNISVSDTGLFTFTIDRNTCSQYPNSTFGSLKLTLSTFKDDIQVGTSVSKTIDVSLPEDIIPTLNIVTSDINGHYSVFNQYISTKSKLKIVADAIGILGATISSYKIHFNNNTYNSSSVELDLDKGGEFPIEITVIDSRGKKTTEQSTITIFDYTNPSISSLKCVRCNEDGTTNKRGNYARITLDYGFTSIDENANSAIISVYYKKKSDGDENYSLVKTDTVTDTNGSFDIITDTIDNVSYDFKIIIEDYFVPITLMSSVGIPYTFWSIFGKGTGFSFGKVASKDNLLDVAWDLNVDGTFSCKKITPESILDAAHPIGNYYISDDPTSPAELFGGTWTRLAGYFLYAEGDDAWIGNTGGSSTLDFYHKHYSPFGYDSTQYYATDLWGTNVIQTTGYYFRDLPGGSATPVRMNKTSEPLDDNNNGMYSKSIMPPYIRVAVWKRIA